MRAAAVAQRHAPSRFGLWLGALGFAVVGVLAVLVAAWLPVPAVDRTKTPGSSAENREPLRVQVSGTVRGPKGAPAERVLVFGQWRAVCGARGCDRSCTVGGAFSALTGSDGRYAMAHSVREDHAVRHRERLTVELTLHARSRHTDDEPLPPVQLAFSPGVEPTQDLRLGAALPSVPIQVSYASGRPVEKFSVRLRPAPELAAPAALLGAAREAGYEPPWAVAEEFRGEPVRLLVPSRRFYVAVQIPGLGCEAEAGPFDPRLLPPCIDVTLPDR